MKEFDYLIPLGMNCELGFNLMKYVGEIDCNFLQWSVAGINTDFYRLITTPEVVFTGNAIQYIPKSNMIKCDITNIICHCKGKASELAGESGKVSQETINNQIEDAVGRMRHLSQKFRLICEADCSKLFIFALHPFYRGNDLELIDKTVKTLIEALRIYKKYDILIICDDLNIEKMLSHTPAFIRHLEKFAPFTKATSPEYMDNSGWKKIFCEFRQKIYKADTKIYKFQDK